jgi:predicted Rossmann fold flavoprotein
MKIFVIGAGVSSLAFCSFLQGRDITVLEKNDVAGRKLLATGNGRCNFTNLNISYDNYYGNDPDFVKYGLDHFSGKDLRDYFENIGLERTSLKSGRCYPKTMSSKTVRDEFLYRAEKNANIIYKAEVLDIDFSKKLIITKDSKFKYDILVIATGGESLKNSGSDGKMFEIIKKHTGLTKRAFGITNFKTKEKIPKKCKGTKVDARASLFVDGKKIKESTDDIIFQDYGLTGTAILDISNSASLALEENKKVRLDIDFYPEYTKERLYEKLSNKAKLYKNRPLQELLNGFIHDKLIIYLLQRSKIEKDKNFKYTNEDLKKLAGTMKALSFNLTQVHDKNNAQVTLGGVDTRFIDPKTMKSKVLDSVYFIGEMMDVAGDCGGYNIQWAFSSAKCASDDIRRLNV